MPKLSPKALVLGTLFGRWRRAPRPVGGYTVLIPTPSDMPFLLRFALEGLSGLDTRECRQILVIPDGSGSDGGAALRGVVRSCGDPRVECVPLGPALRFVVGRVRRGQSGGAFANWAHWAMIVEAVNRCRAEYLFLHDADAFFVDADGLRRQYAECRDRGMVTLGVQYRSDPFFDRIGYTIPGTWEMMLSVPWARGRPPIALKGNWHDTPHGRHEFDTTLYPQYLDFPGGRVGAMAAPPRIVHFHGTITTYRTFRERPGRPVVDELFRLLLLSVLEELVPGAGGPRVMPPPGELARGLDDPGAAVTYGSAGAAREYPGFRRQIDELCESPTFAGARADQVRDRLRPFDDHYAARAGSAPAEPQAARTRRHGLG